MNLICELTNKCKPCYKGLLSRVTNEKCGDLSFYARLFSNRSTVSIGKPTTLE